MVTLVPVRGDREHLLPLLMEADESEAVVRSYLEEGELFAIRKNEEEVGVALFLRDGDEVEIKNIAIVEGRRRQGLGRAALLQIERRAREAGAKRLIVGTANSSLGTLRFYQLAGFRISALRTGFFDVYPEPIWEDGIRARDMVMLSMDL
jgi:ribosomal protein S18 acetylase RimI-like enzyme